MRMQKFSLIFVLFLFVITIKAQEIDSVAIKTALLDSSFHYQHGTVKLKNDIGSIRVPAGFKYLDPEQSSKVLVDIWGNPKEPGEATLGMLFPENGSVMTSWAFNIVYDEIGYVKDDDADDINYEELLEEMKKESEEENKERTKNGYQAIKIIGWAAKPYYDKERKTLHWAKEFHFEGDSVNTLNYNVRVLGRKGVMVLNAIASMDQFDEVNKNIGKVQDVVQFADGKQYKDFDPKIDEVAAWTIGGLVAGKVLAKVGFFAVLVKFWKIIAIAVAGAGTAVWKWIKTRFSGGENPYTATEEEQPQV
jgi:uncharacterized membrane-anchored protein